jgi:flavin-dependent dehydrogenase
MKVDAIVVGAGPAGSAYALVAARDGACVHLVGPPPRHQPNTLELLHERAGAALWQLGLVEATAAASTPCDGVVSGWAERMETRISLTAPYGCGWIVDRNTFDRLVIDAARSNGAHWHQGSATALVPAGPIWQVRVGDSWQSTDTVILATGNAGRLLRQTNLRRRVTSRAVALVAWTARPLPELGNRLFVEAARDGWWYGLATEQGTSLAYVTDVDLLPRVSNRTAAGWRVAATRLGWSCAQSLRPTARSARTGVFEGPPVRGLHLVGDAALAPDPLSGHGLTLALEGALALATEPHSYSTWLATTTVEHQRQQQATYAAVRRDLCGPFHQRRLAGGQP